MCWKRNKGSEFLSFGTVLLLAGMALGSSRAAAKTRLGRV